MTHFARALGAARSGDAASAQKREPNRLRGYYGAGLAASQAGERAKAKEHFGRLAAVRPGAFGVGEGSHQASQGLTTLTPQRS
jgi:hypothetical protein